MSKSIIISERDNIAAISEGGRVLEFFIHRGDILMGDIYLAKVENILPSIDAAFVNVGNEKMGFLHASDITGKGALKERLQPKQSVIVQVVKEPTGHKGPRVTMAISLPGRFLVIMPNEKGVNVSRKISSAKERARLKSIVSLLKPTGVGVIIRTEAENQSESEIQEDLEFLLEKWNNIITASDTVTPPSLLCRDQDLLYRVIREAATDDVKEIVLDTSFGYHRATQLLQSWNILNKIDISVHKGTDSILVSRGIEKEIRNALQTKVNLPSGGYLYIQSTEALSVIDVNSGKFTASATQDETIRKTNLEAVSEIARQLRLRNIGGMIIVDFIDMENRVDKLAVLEEFEVALEPDKSKPQIGQLSDLGLVELTRHRQGQSLAEIFTKKCTVCNGNGSVIEDFNFAAPPQEGETMVKTSRLKFTKPVGKEGFSVNESRKQVNSEVQTRIANSSTKKIETNPSMTASANSPAVSRDEKSAFVLNGEIIKKFFSDSSFTPKVSRLVRYYAVPSAIARNYLGSRYTPDVFTILQELESIDQKGNSPAGNNGYKNPHVAQKPNTNQGQGNPQNNHQNSQYNRHNQQRHGNFQNRNPQQLNEGFRQPQQLPQTPQSPLPQPNEALPQQGQLPIQPEAISPMVDTSNSLQPEVSTEPPKKRPGRRPIKGNSPKPPSSNRTPRVQNNPPNQAD